ncbi:MAG: NAD-dependent protein deacetylase [Myxococcales bacterium]|nr:NAD-dependent protein deacetylase [Myxococcales bacterium]
MLDGARMVALTGAGMSTDSGIPDYRGPESSKRPRKPIQHADFIRSEAARKRYWARAMIGWPRFIAARPNQAHVALARLEGAGLVPSTITQNVDRLHQAAGSRSIIELHGALAEVRCLACGAIEPRDRLQQRLEALNPELDSAAATIAPDGDADLPPEMIEGVRICSCSVCDGVLKPNVVFFGDNVAKPIVEDAFARVEAADVLAVLGSSLHVYSGYRFVKRAHERGIPVVIVNQGPTRGDDLAALRVDAPLGVVLPWLARSLAG